MPIVCGSTKEGNRALERERLMIPSLCEYGGMDQISSWVWFSFPFNPSVRLMTLFLKDARGLEYCYPKSGPYMGSISTPGSL